ncbi:hypothetical protein Pfo_011923 [Paulownia fortunei]|nr:hypothetical protein Pfo_011923 [Paulownia fortunei]
MRGPVQQEWRRVAKCDETDEKRVDEGKICGECSTGFVGSSNKDAAKKGSAKAHLHELCARKHWKQPVFECYNDEGPDHQKQYTFKVLVEIEESSTIILECFGNPRTNKKASAEDAAEGALWCLKYMGYQLKKQ